ncbi:unnamed protein product [Symbiodinium sp. CCMP2456]|nr:unnamed protein product [Symbiodinium sp. CCMP2456]
MGASQSTLRALQRARPVVVAAPVVWAIPRQYWHCETPAPAPVQAAPKPPEILRVPPAKVPQRVLCPAPAFKERKISDGAVCNIVLLGLTGAGKSTLANQIATTRAFKSAASMSSVTEKVIAALQQFANVAEEGLVAVIVVVKYGRFTDENQAVIKYIETVLGHEALVKHGMLVVTSTRKSTDELQKELAALLDSNLGRDMARKVGSRLLGVDKSFFRWPPFKTKNDIMHQVEELLATNKNMGVDCDVMSWGARLQQQQLMEFEQQTASQRKQHAEKEQMLNECHANDRENIMKEKRAIEELLQETQDKHDETLKQMARRLQLEENTSLTLKSRLEDKQRQVSDLEAKITEAMHVMPGGGLLHREGDAATALAGVVVGAAATAMAGACVVQ